MRERGGARGATGLPPSKAKSAGAGARLLVDGLPHAPHELITVGKQLRREALVGKGDAQLREVLGDARACVARPRVRWFRGARAGARRARAGRRVAHLPRRRPRAPPWKIAPRERRATLESRGGRENLTRRFQAGAEQPWTVTNSRRCRRDGARAGGHGGGADRVGGEHAGLTHRTVRPWWDWPFCLRRTIDA